MLQIAERVCTLRSLIDRECGIVGEVWKKYQKLIVGGGRGWNSREDWKKVKILIAKGRVGS